MNINGPSNYNGCFVSQIFGTFFTDANPLDNTKSISKYCVVLQYFHLIVVLSVTEKNNIQQE